MRTPCRSRDLAEPIPAAGRKPTSTAGAAKVLHEDSHVERTRMTHNPGNEPNRHGMSLEEDGMKDGADRGNL